MEQMGLPEIISASVLFLYIHRGNKFIIFGGQSSRNVCRKYAYTHQKHISYYTRLKLSRRLNQ